MVKKATQSPIERPLPFSGEAERALLATGILENSTIPELNELVSAEDFFVSQNRTVYLAMMGLASEGKPVDLVTLTEELYRTKQVEQAGGAGYVASLTDGAARVSNTKHYASIVREAAQKRRVIHACEALKDRAFDGEDDSTKLLEDGTQQFLSHEPRSRVRAAEHLEPSCDERDGRGNRLDSQQGKSDALQLWASSG